MDNPVNYVKPPNAIDLNGVIIKIDGEQAFAHHGGYVLPDSDPLKYAFEPVPVPWSIVGMTHQFDFTGYWARVMAVIWEMEQMFCLSSPVWVCDGTFSIDWDTGADLGINWQATRTVEAL